MSDYTLFYRSLRQSKYKNDRVLDNFHSLLKYNLQITRFPYLPRVLSELKFSE